MADSRQVKYLSSPVFIREVVIRHGQVHLAGGGRRLDDRVHEVPREIDQEVARMKLAAIEVSIDELTAEQQNYLSSWEEGT